MNLIKRHRGTYNFHDGSISHGSYMVYTFGLSLKIKPFLTFLFKMSVSAIPSISSIKLLFFEYVNKNMF